MSILIADPSMITRRSIANVLRPLGRELREAETIEGALAACDASVEMVVLGWAAGFDGLALARQLRDQNPDPRPRVVVVTAHHRRDDVAAAAEAGCDAYVLRPIDPAYLLQRASSILETCPAAVEAAGNSEAPPADGEAQAA